MATATNNYCSAVLQSIKGIVQKTIIISGATLFFFNSLASAALLTVGIERFEVTGNLIGSYVDEFNDGIVTPWDIQDGIVTESNDLLMLSRTDTDTFMESRADSPANLLNDGEGDFIASSFWLPEAPSLNASFSMITELRPAPEIDDEDLEIGIYNLSPENADQLGLPSGTVAYLLHTIETGPAAGTVEFYTSPISIQDIVDSIALSISYDADLFSAGFSLDGGTTFINPFPSIAPGYAVNSLTDFELFAGWSMQVQPIPIPATLGLFIIGLLGISLLRSRL